MIMALRTYLSVFCPDCNSVSDFVVTNRGGCARAVIRSHKRLRKTLITTQQARGTTGGKWVVGGENQSLKSLDNLEGPFGLRLG